MKTRTLTKTLSALMIGATILLSACGGGTGDSTTANGSTSTQGPAGPDSFLLFPNSLQEQPGGTLVMNTSTYANAYYQAIDPSSQRTTLADFKAANRIGIGAPLGVGENEVTLTIGDQRDLGYGRKLTGRMNADGTIAFIVENFLVGYGPYSPISLEAAVRDERHWFIGTNAIEFSAAPGGNGVKFVKFFTYDNVTGARVTAANLDGRGTKALPTICTNCHGGRGDPLTPNGQFAKVTYSASGARGDVGAQAHGLEPAAFDFSSVSGFTRASLEANLKEFNKMVLCTYAKPTTETTGAFDTCRRTATADEYQGTAAAHIKHMYGGDNLPNATAEATESYLPGNWGSAGQASLYNNTVSNACRICHSIRGTGTQSDIDFESFTKFDGYSDRIKAHVVDRGNMPLAKLVYDKFWTTPNMNGAMASYLSGKGFSDASAKPGRPVADPGPDRVLKSNSTTLSAAMSLYANTYQWTVTSGSATLTNATSATPTFTATADGTYTVQLVVGNGVTTSDAKTLTIVVDSTLGWDPQAVSFNNATAGNQIRDILQSNVGGTGCVSCHADTLPSTVIPPSFYNDYDRAGTGNATDPTNRNWLYAEVRGRVNFSDIVASPLLRKPSGKHHNGGLQPGFTLGALTQVANNPPASNLPGNAARQSYDKLVAWILRGAPEN